MRNNEISPKKIKVSRTCQKGNSFVRSHHPNKQTRSTRCALETTYFWPLIRLSRHCIVSDSCRFHVEIEDEIALTAQKLGILASRKKGNVALKESYLLS